MANNVTLISSDAQGLRCPICLDVYTAPKNLPCLHTYCQHCLQSYIMQNVPKGKKVVSFSCPECKKETPSPPPDIPVDKWAEHYPYNTVMLSVLPPEKRKVDKNCGSCICEGKLVKPTTYCTVCKDALCFPCEKVHRKNKATKDHTVVNIQNLFTDLQLAISLSVSVTCYEHVGKEYEFYCKFHSRMCCSECFYKSHRGCNEVLQIKDHSERLMQEKDSNTVVLRLKHLKSHLDQFKTINEESFLKIKAEMNNVPDEIEQLRNKLNTLLDNVKAKLLAEKNALLKNESLIQNEEIKQCESISSAITNSLHLLETTLAHGNPLHALTTLHKTEEQLIHYESTVNEKYSEVRHVDAKLCLDDRLLSLTKNSGTSAAKIDIVEKKLSLKTSQFPLPKEKTVKATSVGQHALQTQQSTVEEHKKTPRFIRTKPLKNCKPEKIGDFQAHYQNGNNPSYTGITCLQDDKIMLVDGHNCSCRLYDSSYQHIADYNLSSWPWGVCVVEGSQVAVTLPVEQSIQLLTVDRSIRPGRKIKTSLNCSGIAALSRDQLFVIGGKDNNVLYWCIVSMDGSEKSLVEVGPTYHCGHLAVNNSRTRIYVSCNQDTAAVYAYSVVGTRIFKYEHHALDGASGIAVDREDNLYVVGRVSRNIHQVSPDGSHLQVFSTGIPTAVNSISTKIPIWPVAICFTSSGDEFFLAEDPPHGNSKLHVHKFKMT
ncbi:hypothetical protein CHS0354_037532 [Potamilus streckersoni]|uniref:RING-type domain-containing protein n=1 Tax=Potamilus streckersoni TaxID=2493646 RepID=A0AAE0RPG1_9BIVA|nr:hypothetical protein CHS0354_037532 [Potamilus streckersoni]